uniref:Putative secreted protein n=1 Tax=Ixodes ricinus TaxID=34613 RepID=A0A6B0TXA3_IXORI
MQHLEQFFVLLSPNATALAVDALDVLEQVGELGHQGGGVHLPEGGVVPALAAGARHQLLPAAVRREQVPLLAPGLLCLVAEH